MVFRLDPKLPVNAYTTYQAVRPRSTHTRPATCKEIDCAAFHKGWQTRVDVATDLGRRQANYIRLRSGRHFTAVQTGTLVTFTFPPGQHCFAAHTVALDKPTIFLKRGGDWRATTTPAVRMSDRDWLDDFANHQLTLAEARERG